MISIKKRLFKERAAEILGVGIPLYVIKIKIGKTIGRFCLAIFFRFLFFFIIFLMAFRYYFQPLFIYNVIHHFIQNFLKLGKIFLVKIYFVLFVMEGTIVMGKFFAFCHGKVVIIGLSTPRSEEHTSE